MSDENATTTTAPAAAANPTTENKGTSEASAPWHSGYAERLSPDTYEAAKPLFEKYGTEEEYVRGMGEQAKVVGKKGLIKPGKDATDEERGAFFNELGRPEKAEGYAWSPAEESKFHIADQERYTEAQGKLHALGLTQDQYAGVMDLYTEELGNLLGKMHEQQEGWRSESEATFKQEWGEDYAREGKAVMAETEKRGLREVLEEAGLINHPGIIRLIKDAKDGTAEDAVEKSEAVRSIDAELDELKKTDAWKNARHPDHTKAKAKYQALHRRKVGVS
ncbi:MAG: hypothetical protein Q7Q73_02500 [Verrucomicrobiota bacterium JB024]|nr:hypothetical protein [Verrucomicrobiota bacterium JB024]